MPVRARLLVATTALCVVALRAAPHSASPPHSPWSVPVNLGNVVNSSWEDALAALSKDGLSLYFTSNRPPEAGGDGSFDIWVSQRVTADAPWGPPTNLGLPVNTTAAEAGPALSRDGHWLFFHRTTAAGDFDLMASWRQFTHDDFGWEEPVNLGPAVNSTANDAGAAYFAGDESSSPELFFGSTRFGGFDLFVSRLSSDGTFGPATLIPELSSPAGDQRPTISHDGKEIFFHSNRIGSIAGTNDIWTSTRPTLFDPWEPPTNVAELNTAFADVQPTLSSDSSTLVFNSNRPGGFGGNDLYVVTRTKLAGNR